MVQNKDQPNNIMKCRAQPARQVIEPVPKSNKSQIHCSFLAYIVIEPEQSLSLVVCKGAMQ